MRTLIDPAFDMKVEDTERVLADGNGKVAITISNALYIAGNKILVTKNSGALVDAVGAPLPGNEIALSSREAVTFYLKVGQAVEDYFIRVQNTAGTVVRNATFRPQRAYGEELFVDAEKINSGYNLTAGLKRLSGKVSTGTPVAFRAYQLVEDEEKELDIINNLRNAYTDTAEEVRVTVTDRSLRYRPATSNGRKPPITPPTEKYTAAGIKPQSSSP